MMAPCMTNENDMRLQLKLALMHLEAAREERRAGYVLPAPLAEMQLLEIHVARRSEVLTELMLKLINHTRPSDDDVQAGL